MFLMLYLLLVFLTLGTIFSIIGFKLCNAVVNESNKIYTWKIFILIGAFLVQVVMWHLLSVF